MEKQRGGESEKRRREDQRGERVRRKNMQAREGVEKLRFTVLFQWFGAPEGRKVGSLKRRVRSHLARWEMRNCTPLWREPHFEVKSVKTDGLGPLLSVQTSFRMAGGGDCATLPKASKKQHVQKRWQALHRTLFEEDPQRCISCGRGSTRDMFIIDMRRSGRWFPERGCILEHRILRFAKMILHDRCSTSHDLA